MTREAGKSYCYEAPDPRKDQFVAEPHRTICYCGRDIEQNEKGVWFHVGNK